MHRAVTKRHKNHYFSIIISIACIFAIIVWGCINNSELKLKQISIESDKILAPLKIAIISDMHDRSFGDENKDLLAKLEETDVDVFLILGDMMNDTSKNVECAISFLSGLVKLEKPVYYALGNHEYGYMEATGDELIQKISATGAIVLEKKYLDLNINDQMIRIGGLYDYAFALDGDNTTKAENMNPEIYQFLTSFQDTDAYKIMLSHRPDSFIFGEASKTWNIDLVVSGHLHGGQAVLPFIGGMYAPDQGFFPEYVHGLYQKDLLQILITRGLGSHKETLPRWNNSPEIMLLELN